MRTNINNKGDVIFDYLAVDNIPKKVAIYGSFSQWQEIPLTQIKPGYWHVKIRIPGTDIHLYRFAIDGAEQLDPKNLLVRRNTRDNKIYSELWVSPQTVRERVAGTLHRLKFCILHCPFSEMKKCITHKIMTWKP